MNNNYTEVDILMSTYNGQKYIEQQIESIRTQTSQNWRLIIRDDGSLDDTRLILNRLSAKEPRITIINESTTNYGVSNSFISLLKYVEAPYFMFCDQDDVWLPYKISDSLNFLKNADNIPHLVFSDLKVVNSELEDISSSFIKYQRFNPIKGISFKRIAMQNVVVGCSLAGNRLLLNKCALCTSPPPCGIIMHDWWLALVASYFGKITFLNKPTILYRQHENNCLGAPGSSFCRYISMILYDKPWIRAQNYLCLVSKQAESFMNYYSINLNREQLACLNRIASIRHKTTILSLVWCFLNGSVMNGADRNLALLLSICLGRRKNIC